MQLFTHRHKMNKSVHPGVVDIFMRYDWPGNFRKLENLIKRMVVITPKDIITAEDLPLHLMGTVGGNSSYMLVSGIIPLKDAIESVEKQLIEKVYAKYRTTRQMAKELEVDTSMIVRKAAKYHITQVISL